VARCVICGGNPRKTKFGYTKPDKYEKWVGIENVKRLWVRCECGFYWQLRNYPLSRLEKIYVDGYRDPGFRGETIAEAYKRLRYIKESENEERYFWFASRLSFKKSRKVLDIGSGVGVWPAILKAADYEVTCVETNTDSIDFIYDHLGIKCYRNLSNVGGTFDTVSLIHVLEHIEDIDGFLKAVRKKLRGYLFVEVPDSEEFELLDKDHDEFNSCHVNFFDMASLYRVLKRNGFKPFDASKVRYKSRGLTRLLMLCN